jgi:hypothetical protein
MLHLKTVEPEMNADLDHEEIEANVNIDTLVKVTKVYIPIAIYSSMGLNWIAGMDKYFE